VILNVEGFLNNKVLDKKIFLFYGENSELVEQLNREVISQNQSYIKKNFYNDDIVKNSDQLNNLISSNNIFGEKFLIIIRNLTDSGFIHIKNLFKKVDKCIVIVNCEILKKNSKIRFEFENSSDATVVPCYNDSEKELFSFLCQNLKQKKININFDQLKFLQTKKNMNRSKIAEIIYKLEILNSAKTPITMNILECICNNQDTSNKDEFSLLSNTSRQEIINFLDSKQNPLENIIIFKNTIFRILKILDTSTHKKNLFETLDAYKPKIFWKEKEKIKKILKFWKIEDLKKLICKLNDLETNLKKNYDLSQLYQNNFFTNELFKKAFKGGDNFI